MVSEEGVRLFAQGLVARASFEHAALVAPHEPVAHLNLMWQEALDNREVAEMSSSLQRVAQRLVSTTKAACLHDLDGEEAPSGFAQAAMTSADANLSISVVDGLFRVDGSYEDARTIADLDLGPQLCDFPGMDSSQGLMTPQETYVDLVKRWTLGYVEGPWDMFFHGAMGTASSWDSNDVLSFARLGSLNLFQLAVKDALARTGDVAECGVFRGGTALVAAATIQAYEPAGDRVVWAFDTFDGVPDKDEHTDDWPSRSYKADEAAVRRNFGQLGLEHRLRTVVGKFADVEWNTTRLAVLRIDADTYSGTYDALTLLYDHLELGALVIVDDHHLSGCRRALRDFRAERNISSPLLPAPTDYVLGCPLRHRDPRRCRSLATDLLGLTASHLLLRDVMHVPQNVYWRKY